MPSGSDFHAATAYDPEVDLRLLTTFSAVVELGSVSAAAEALHVTQPALSRQLQQLERQVGVSLFHRHHRRLNLTPAGHSFLAAARDVLAAAEAARSLAEALAAGRLERIRAAAPATTLTDVVAPFLATLGPEDPLVTVHEATAVEAVEGLSDRLDLVVLASPPPRHLASAVVAELPVWAYARSGHEVAGRRSIPVAELAGHTLLTLDPRAGSRSRLGQALLRAGVAPLEVVECSSPQVALALAASGRGVAVLSDDPRFDLTPTVVLDGDRPLLLTLFAAWNPAHHAAAELARMAARLAEFCRQRYPAVHP